MEGSLFSAVVVFIVLTYMICKHSFREIYLFDKDKFVPKWFTVFIWFYTAWGFYNLFVVINCLLKYYGS
jgi:hypothetical protein